MSDEQLTPEQRTEAIKVAMHISVSESDSTWTDAEQRMSRVLLALDRKIAALESAEFLVNLRAEYSRTFTEQAKRIEELIEWRKGAEREVGEAIVYIRRKCIGATGQLPNPDSVMKAASDAVELIVEQSKSVNAQVKRIAELEEQAKEVYGIVFAVDQVGLPHAELVKELKAWWTSDEHNGQRQRAEIDRLRKALELLAARQCGSFCTEKGEDGNPHPSPR